MIKIIETTKDKIAELEKNSNKNTGRKSIYKELKNIILANPNKIIETQIDNYVSFSYSFLTKNDKNGKFAYMYNDKSNIIHSYNKDTKILQIMLKKDVK